MLPSAPLQPVPESNPVMEIERPIAKLLDGDPAPTDPEDVRLAEYRALLDALTG